MKLKRFIGTILLFAGMKVLMMDKDIRKTNPALTIAPAPTPEEKPNYIG